MRHEYLTSLSIAVAGMMRHDLSGVVRVHPLVRDFVFMMRLGLGVMNLCCALHILFGVGVLTLASAMIDFILVNNITVVRLLRLLVVISLFFLFIFVVMIVVVMIICQGMTGRNGQNDDPLANAADGDGRLVRGRRVGLARRYR